MPLNRANTVPTIKIRKMLAPGNPQPAKNGVTASTKPRA